MAELSQYSDEQLRALSDADFDAVVSGNVGGLSPEGRRALGVKGGRLDMLDTATSIAGSILGGIAGSVVPGAGTAAGAVAGGAIGAGLGEFIENKIAGVSPSQGVAKAMGTSAMWDAGTLGAGKLFRVGRSLFGKGVYELTDEVRTLSRQAIPDIATREGQQLAAGQSQALALQKGASLPISATESAGFVRRVIDQVGRASLLTKGSAEKSTKALNEAVVSYFDDLVAGAEKYQTFDEIGDHFVRTIAAGNEAAQAIYGKKLGELESMMANVDFKASPIVSQVQKFLKDNQKKAVREVMVKSDIITSSGAQAMTKKVVDAPLSNLSKDVIKKATDIVSELDGVTFKGSGVIEYQKQIRNMINDAYDANQPNIARQLIQLEDAVKTGIEQSMKASGRKEFAEKYAAMNSEYSKMRNSLFPKYNERMIKKAIDGDAQSLMSIGKVLSTASGSNVGKVKEFMNSIDSSLKIIAESEGKSAAWIASEASRIKKSARAGFLYHETNKLDGSKILSTSFVDSILKPENAAKMQAIFGEEWDALRRGLNFAKTAAQPGGKLGGLSLILNGMQFGALQAGAAGALTLGASGTPLPNWAEVMAILVAPSVFYKIATRPQAINRLIALDNKIAKDGVSNIKPEIVMSSFAKIMSSLSPEEKAEARATAVDMGIGVYF